MSEVEFVIKIRAAGDLIREAADEYLEKLGRHQGIGVKEETFTSLLGWTATKGNRIGDYEYTSQEANQNSDAFKRAMQILKNNSASISSRFHDEGFKYGYWIYDKKPSVIYRKLLGKKQETFASPEKPKEQGGAVEKVQALFPKDLEDLLTFEETANYVVIKPRQYLGSENFSKIAAIVREASGEYISAGKESHFRIPVKK